MLVNKIIPVFFSVFHSLICVKLHFFNLMIQNCSFNTEKCRHDGSNDEFVCEDFNIDFLSNQHLVIAAEKVVHFNID